jgi:hypothetical protein
MEERVDASPPPLLRNSVATAFAVMSANFELAKWPAEPKLQSSEGWWSLAGSNR